MDLHSRARQGSDLDCAVQEIYAKPAAQGVHLVHQQHRTWQCSSLCRCASTCQCCCVLRGPARQCTAWQSPEGQHEACHCQPAWGLCLQHQTFCRERSRQHAARVMSYLTACSWQHIAGCTARSLQQNIPQLKHNSLFTVAAARPSSIGRAALLPSHEPEALFLICQNTLVTHCCSQAAAELVGP